MLNNWSQSSLPSIQPSASLKVRNSKCKVQNLGYSASGKDNCELARTGEIKMGREIEKVRVACFNSGHRLEDHIVDVNDMVEIEGA